MNQTVFILTVLLLLGVTSVGTRAQNDTVKAGVNKQMLATTLDPNDMKIVLEYLLKVAQFGMLQTNIVSYENDGEMFDAIGKGEVEVFALLSPHYLRTRGQVKLEPIAQLAGKSSELVLLAHPKAEATSLNDFKGSDIIIDTRLGLILPMMWTELLLHRNGALPSGKFFGEIQHVQKPAKAAVPVYFGKQPLCITTKSAWEGLCELNPQLQKLKLVAKSDGLMAGLLAVTADIDQKKLSSIKKGLYNLHETVAGSTALRFVKIERIDMFNEATFKYTEQVYNAFQNLPAEYKENVPLIPNIPSKSTAEN